MPLIRWFKLKLGCLPHKKQNYEMFLEGSISISRNMYMFIDWVGVCFNLFPIIPSATSQVINAVDNMNWNELHRNKME